MMLMAAITATMRCDLLIRLSSRGAEPTRRERAISYRSLARHTGVAGVSASGAGAPCWAGYMTRRDGRTDAGGAWDVAACPGRRWPEHALAGVLRGDPGEGDAGVDSELLERVAEVSADGVRGDVKPLSDLSVGQAAGDQPDDGEL